MIKQEVSLGTAQFGLDYGITNKTGKVSLQIASEILDAAWENNIKCLDTAQGYGDVEEVLEKTIRNGKDFKITTKLKASSDRIITVNDIEDWEQRLFMTIRRLKNAEVHTLLVHSIDDLKKDGAGFLADWLLSLKTRGVVQRVGVSIYDERDLAAVPTELQDVVQVPVSLYDQRLVKNGIWSDLKNRGSLIQARSIYLQGLILSPSTNLPDWIPDHLKRHHRQLEKLAAKLGLRLIDLAVQYIRSVPQIDTLIAGVTSVDELIQLKNSAASMNCLDCVNWSKWAFDEEHILDPRLWPR